MNTSTPHQRPTVSAHPIEHSPLDRLIMGVDIVLRTIWGEHTASRPCPRPAPGAEQAMLSEAEKREAAALMRVNHVGEVCAQALYASQSLGTRDPALRAQFEAAAREETDHLAWTEQRLRELGGRTSLLNPLWYLGSLSLGVGAGILGDRWNLGFLSATERQVEAHLLSHLERLPQEDQRSRAIVEQMRENEARHADMADAYGAASLPAPVQVAMRAMAGIMTRLAHHI